MVPGPSPVPCGMGLGPGKKAEGRRQKAGLIECLSVCPDLQALLLAGLPTSVSGSWIPEPLVSSTTGAEYPLPDRSRLPGKGVGRACSHGYSS